MNTNELQAWTTLSKNIQVVAVVLVFLGGFVQVAKHFLDKQRSRWSNTAKIVAIILVFAGGLLQAGKIYFDLKTESTRQQLSQSEKRTTDSTIAAMHATIQAESLQIQKQSATISANEERVHKVEAASKPRTISSQDFEAMRKELSTLKGDSIEISSVLGDNESIALASQLRDLFKSSGWFIRSEGQTMYLSPVRGISFKFRSRAAIPVCDFVHRTLVGAGFDVRGGLVEKLECDVSIDVGSK